MKTPMKPKPKIKPTRYAASGLPKVPGKPKGPDVVPAWLRPGEAVLTPQAAEMVGRGNIQRLNEQTLRLGAMAPRYYAGGEDEVASLYQQERERQAGQQELALQVAAADGAFAGALGEANRYAAGGGAPTRLGRAPVAAPGELVDTGQGWQVPNPLPGQVVDTPQGWQTPNPVLGQAIDTPQGWRGADQAGAVLDAVDTGQGWQVPEPVNPPDDRPDDQPQYFMGGTAHVSRLGQPLYFAGGGMIDPKTGKPYAEAPATPQPSLAYQVGRNVAEPLRAGLTGLDVAKTVTANQVKGIGQAIGQGVADVARGASGQAYTPPAKPAAAGQPVLGRTANPDANFAKPITVTDRAGRPRVFDNPAMMAAAAPTLMQNKAQAYGPEYYQDRTVEHARGNYGAPSPAKQDLMARYAGQGPVPAAEYVDVYNHFESPERKAQLIKAYEANQRAQQAAGAQESARLAAGLSAVPEWRPDYRPPASPRDQLLQQQLQGERLRQRQLSELYSLATTSPSDSPRTANALAMYQQLAGSYGGSPGALSNSFGALVNQQGNPAENQWRLGQAHLSQAQAGTERYRLQHPELLGTRAAGEWKALGGDNYLQPEGQTGFPIFNTATGESRMVNPAAQPTADNQPPSYEEFAMTIRKSMPNANDAQIRAAFQRRFGG